MKGIADTGFLVAFANRKDKYHAWAVSLAAEIDQPLLTCESVLSETAFHLQNAGLVMAMIDEGLVGLAFDAKKNLSELKVLAKRYGDRTPDFADLCLVRMSELFPKHTIFTVDADFRVYRRNGREVIPINAPPTM